MIHVLSYFPKYMCCWEYLPATNICSDFGLKTACKRVMKSAVKS